jgi:hypothetical protein
MVQASIQQFADAAGRFCSLVQQPSAFGPRTFALRCAELLAALYQRALALPDVELSDADGVPRGAVSHEHWQAIYRGVSESLGETDLYWLVSDPFNHGDHEPDATTLSDDLADIYRDLMEGLVTYRGGSEQAVSVATWNWKFGFQRHWGRHLVHALSVLHVALSDSRLGD